MRPASSPRNEATANVDDETRSNEGDLLVVGLGNPGVEHDKTRHNAGIDTVQSVALRLGVSLKNERGVSARIARCVIGDRRVVLAMSSTFMNESGVAVRALLRRVPADLPRDLVIVHDELDLPVGSVRVKLDGGTAGHNGLRSIESHLKTLGFVRVRIGIGRPPGQMNGASYVLARPRKAEQEQMDDGLELGADAIELIATRGVQAAMNIVNSS